MKHAKTETTRSWFMVIFGAFFALPGLFILIMLSGGSVYDAVRMQTWIETDANIISSQVKHYSGDSSTYKVVADYTYSVNGRTYEGDRVSIHSGSDNVGSYHHDMNRKLQRSRGEVTVFYDPDKPSDAVIDRSLRWEMVGFTSIFGFIFGLVGCGIMYFGFKGETRIVSPETAEKPWLSNPKWAENKISSNVKAEMYGLIVFSLFWNLITWPVLLLNGASIVEEVHPMILLVMAIFPLTGIFLIYLTIKSIRQHNAFGKTPLTLTPFPGSIGGQIGGKISFERNISSLTSFPVKVVCLKKHISGSGKNRRTNERLVWESDTFARHYTHGIGSGLEFRVDVPDNLPETDINKDSSWHEWRVDIDSPDIKLKRSFEIPVYRTAEASEVSYKVPQHLIQNKNKLDLDSSLPVQQQGNEVRIHYPMFYKPTTKVIVAMIGLAMLIAVAVFRQDMPIFVFAMLLLIGGLMAFFSIKSLLSSLTVVLKNSTMEVSKGLFGLFKRTQRFSFSEIAGIERKEVMRSQSGNKHTVHFSVLALLRSGEKLDIAKQIEGESAAALVEEFFREKLGIRDFRNKKMA